MKAQFETDMKSIRQEQERIRALVHRVDEQIHELSEQLYKEPSKTASPTPVPVAGAPTKAGGTPPCPITPPKPTVAPTPLPSTFDAASAPFPRPRDERTESFPKSAAGPGATSVPQEPSVPAAGKETPVAEDTEGLEIRFGRVWLVRIGIVILLTGLVFLGNLAYQHIVPKLGPAGKLSMIALAGGLLCTTGWRLERRRESLRNYGRVLFAGGCAALYYTAYAAHFVKALQVIASPLAGGTLLLALAGGIVWVAHRRKSEPMALLAVLLSYYVSSINPIGGFTLFSSLLLTGCAMFFLVRNRWTKLTFASLVGTYASYAWWRIFGGAMGAESTPVATQIGFLAGYWAIFTAGGFLISQSVMHTALRTTFVSLNNGAFFGLGALAFSFGAPGEFWLFSVILGVVLLGLAKLAALRSPDDEGMDAAYLIQGLVLLALGLTAKLTGYQMALMFAAQSVVLLTGGGKRQQTVRQIGAAISGVLAFALVWNKLPSRTLEYSLTGAAVSLVLAFDAWWLKRKNWREEDLHPGPTVVVGFALLLGVFSLYCSVGAQAMVPWLALGAVLLSVGAAVLRFRELVVCAQWLLPIAGALWVISSADNDFNAASIVAAGIGLALWWPRQRMLTPSQSAKDGHEAVAALTAGAMGTMWLAQAFTGPTAMALATGTGLLWIGLALAARARMLTVAGLIFHAYSLALFFTTLQSAHWAVALIPSAGLLLLAWMTRGVSRLGGDVGLYIPEIREVFIGIAVAILLPWAFEHIPSDWIALFFAASGIVSVVLSRKVQWLAWCALAQGGLAALLMLVRYEMEPTWQHLVAVLAFPAACRWSRRDKEDGPLIDAAPAMAWCTAGMLTLWMLRANHVYEWKIGPTILFALIALALFPAGLLLRERAYRLCGLGLLGLAIGHVFVFDVWAFDPVFRIVSFIVLGLVLLLVGYFYNRFEEQLKRWL